MTVFLSLLVKIKHLKKQWGKIEPKKMEREVKTEPHSTEQTYGVGRATGFGRVCWRRPERLHRPPFADQDPEALDDESLSPEPSPSVWPLTECESFTW